MSLTDKALARRDPGIKGLGTLLDEAAMLDILRQSFPDAGIDAARKIYVRYKPGTNCLVRYQLNSAAGKIEIYAKAHGKQTQEKIAKAALRPTQLDRLGIGRMIVPKQKIIICSFPNDDKLKSLQRLFDHDSRNRLIDRAMFDPKHFRGSRVSQLQYKPERRFVGRLESPSGEFAAIKLYTGTRFEHAAQTARRAVPGDKFPALIGLSKKHRVLILDWIHGERLSDEYATDVLALSSLRDTGEHLARFHKMNETPAIPQQQTNLFIDSLYRLSSGINHLLPSLSTWAESLVEELAQGISSLTTAQTRIHGDFYAKQVLLTEDGVRFIDLDDVCCWHPAYDLGLFIAHLEWDVLRGRLAEERAGQLEKALLEGYCRQNNCSRLEVELFTAVGLMQLAHHPFRDCEDNWAEGIEALLNRCEARLTKLAGALSSRQGKRSASTDNRQVVEIIEDPQMPFLPHITDASQIEETLQNVLQTRFESIHSYTLKKPLIRRHKPGKRVLIEYIFKCHTADEPESSISVLGKARAKGLDKQTCQLNGQLFELGFNPASEDGIQVPEPLGIVRQHHMWLQRKVNGKNPFPMITDPDGNAVASRIAAAIYKLHSSGISVERAHTLDEELRILENSINRVIERRPEWRECLRQILARSRRLAGKIPDTHAKIIHRDFYHDQLLIDKDKLYLLDLDLCSMGDPALDIGNFVAHIQEQCLREFDDPHYASDAMERFVDEYSQLSGTDIRPTVEIYALLTMVRHIFISQRIASRYGYTESIMNYCEQCLSTTYK